MDILTRQRGQSFTSISWEVVMNLRFTLQVLILLAVIVALAIAGNYGNPFCC
jgi:hypothetical protein